MPIAINPQTQGIKVNFRRYGITEKKKAEIDALTLQVLDAQREVDQYQAIVAALTLKLSNFQGLLATADNNRTLALNNKNAKDLLVQSASDLSKNSKRVFDTMALAEKKSTGLAFEIKIVMDKLIYAVEIINKLSNLVVTKKALNPLISDELVSMIGTAGSDANNAVALTLIALKSTYASQATNMESLAASTLESMQAKNLVVSLTVGTKEGYSVSIPDKGKSKDITIAKNEESQSLSKTIDAAYEASKKTYTHIYEANGIIVIQLNHANSLLNKAQVNLQSLQAGLSAANAAALAA